MVRAGEGVPNRGRIDKRAAILEAALRVFAESGFGYASIDAIAVAASVAKPTIYNHFGDKESLFRAVMIDSVEDSAARIVKGVNATPRDDDDVAGELGAIAHAVVQCQVSERGWALQRLLYAEAVRMPDLYDDVVTRGGPPVTNALAGRLALIAYAGHLDLDDPVLAANQFMALITGNLASLSALGTRPLPEDVLATEVNSAVHTFLRAFGTRGDRPDSRTVPKLPRRKTTRVRT